MIDTTLNKHRGNEESNAAFEKIKPKLRASRRIIEELVKDSDFNGITCREAAEKLGVGMNAISGRFSELKAEKIIRKVGRRQGCAVYVNIESNQEAWNKFIWGARTPFSKAEAYYKTRAYLKDREAEK
tara:strand:- start:2236 stop:2619 length:384 start_codon:yes stop_codon:yes gene_type:complete